MAKQWNLLNMPRAKRDPKPIGRPQKIIDWDLVDLMLEAHCTGTEIAQRFFMHPETFYDRVIMEKGVGFSEYAQCKYSKGKTNAKLRQYKSMMSGNTAIMLHWAAHHLDQVSKSQVKQEIKQEITQKMILKLPDNGNREVQENPSEKQIIQIENE
jgi:hypothetical protein